MNYSASILIADDEKGMRTSLSLLLEEEGHRVVTCQNGAEAIRTIQENPVEIVIADLNLPDMTGLEILSALKKASPDAAFILITGFATMETAIEALNQGAFAYHVKPMDMEALNQNVNNALRQQHLLLENRQLLGQMQQSEVKYRTLVEQAGDGIFIAEQATGQFIEVNPRMSTITGRAREELLGLTLSMLLPEREHPKAVAMLESSLVNGQAKSGELAAAGANGEEVFIDLNTSLVDYQGRNVILGIARDITVRKASEAYIRDSSRLVSLGELAAGVAHQINNPLTAIMGFSELLTMEQPSAQVQAYAVPIHSEAQRAAKIVQNLLSFARGSELEKQYADLTAIPERAVELKAYDLKLKNIKVRKEWPEDLPRTMVDEHQIVEVTLNILNNAEQAMTKAHGGGELVVVARRLGQRIVISIKDDGPGIRPEHLEKIFDPFFTTKAVGEGTGLGLSSCYGIVRQHGGEIWAESVPGSGATFHMELPRLGPAGTLGSPAEGKVTTRGGKGTGAIRD